MSYEFWDAVAETPWWVYLLFIAVLNVIYYATKPQIVTLRSTIIAPAIFTGLLIIGMPAVVSFNLASIAIIFICTLIGSLLGWLQFRIRKITAIKNKSQFYVPGSWSLFFFVLALIVAKYYFFGASMTIDPVIFKQEKYNPYIAGLCGFAIGLFIGRTYYLFHTIKVGPFHQNKKPIS